MKFNKFNPVCDCCMAWRKILQEKKMKSRLSSRMYYARNKEKVILSTLKRYYSNQRITKDDGRRNEER